MTHRRPGLDSIAGHFSRLRLDAPAHGTALSRGALSTIGLVLQGLLRFAISLLVGRLAGQVALGVVQSAISTGSLLALLWPTSTGAAASKYLARARGAQDQDELRAVAAHLRRRTLQCSVLLGLAAVVVWTVIDHGTVASAVPVGIFTAAYSGYSFTRGVQFGAGQVARATTWDLVSVVVGVVAVALALTMGAEGTVLTLPLSLAYAAYTAACWPYAAARRPVRSLRRELDRFVLLGAVGTVSSAGLLQLSMIVAKGVGGSAQAGQYAAAFAIATPASMLATSLGLVLFPSLAEALGRGDHAMFRRQTDEATRILVLVMVTVFGAMALCSRFIVALVWGSDYAAAAGPFPILALALLATNVAIASVNALVTGHHRGLTVTTAASVAGLLVGGVAWWVLTPSLGIVGVALGYLCGTLVIGSMPLAAIWRLDHHRWGWLAARLAAGLAAMGALFFGLRAAGLGPAWEPVATVVFWLLWWSLSWSDARVLLAKVRVR